MVFVFGYCVVFHTLGRLVDIRIAIKDSLFFLSFLHVELTYVCSQLEFHLLKFVSDLSLMILGRNVHFNNVSMKSTIFYLSLHNKRNTTWISVFAYCDRLSKS